MNSENKTAGETEVNPDPGRARAGVAAGVAAAGRRETEGPREREVTNPDPGREQAGVAAVMESAAEGRGAGMGVGAGEGFLHRTGSSLTVTAQGRLRFSLAWRRASRAAERAGEEGAGGALEGIPVAASVVFFGEMGAAVVVVVERVERTRGAMICKDVVKRHGVNCV